MGYEEKENFVKSLREFCERFKIFCERFKIFCKMCKFNEEVVLQYLTDILHIGQTTPF